VAWWAGNRNPEFLAAQKFAAARNQFFVDEGAAVLVDPGRGDGGTIFVSAATVPQPFSPDGAGQGAASANAPRRFRPWDKDAPKDGAQVAMAVEHYNRVVRMIQAGERVKMEVELAVEWQEKDLNGYNTIAEIPGSDPNLKHEIVMLGGHMDSWHGGTGATDNGAGVAVGMEAVRIIQALGLKPRRTIRVACGAVKSKAARLARVRRKTFRQNGDARGDDCGKRQRDDGDAACAGAGEAAGL